LEIVNIQVHSVNMVSFAPRTPGVFSAMDNYESKTPGASGILADYFYGQPQGKPQIKLEPIPLYDLMNQNKYAPGVLFSALA